MSNTSETTRCPCGSDEQLRISKKGTEAWVLCKDCNVWQHPICVGLLDDKDHMPNDYFCEECKPQHHGRFFKFGTGSHDPKNRVDIAKQRQKMHKMKPAAHIPAFRERNVWTINEIMAIVEGHSASLAASWITVADLPEAFRKEDGFDRGVILSIRIVIRIAAMNDLEALREKLVKVRFSEGNVVAKELWTLKKWLTQQFIERVKSYKMKKWLENRFETQGLKTMGQTNAALVVKYFNL
jgi:hypothetical protein